MSATRESDESLFPGLESPDRSFEVAHELKEEILETGSEIEHFKAYLSYEWDSRELTIKYKVETTEFVKEELGVKESFAGEYSLEASSEEDAEMLYNEWVNCFQDELDILLIHEEYR